MEYGIARARPDRGWPGKQSALASAVPGRFARPVLRTEVQEQPAANRQDLHQRFASASGDRPSLPCALLAARTGCLAWSTGGGRLGLALLLMLTVWLTGGCQEEPQIRRYTAPRVQPLAPDHTFPASAQMLLGAMTWVNETRWFFRTLGPKEKIEAQRSAFLEFLRSLHLSAERAEWRLPMGWREEKRSAPGRYATLRLGSEEDAPELVVVRFPPGQGGDVAGNVNRWRSMVGLPAVSPAEARALANPLKTDHHEFLLVELTGPEQPR